MEPVNFNKQFNAFAYKELGLMESDRLFNTFNINHNVILQYDRLKKSYYLLIPLDKTINTVVYREEKCGIDIGCRTHNKANALFRFAQFVSLTVIIFIIILNIIFNVS